MKMQEIFHSTMAKLAGLTVVLVLLGTIGFATTKLAKAALGTCISTTMSSVNSPDKKWKYTLLEGYCDGEYIFDTTYVYRVDITSLTDPTKTEWVYEIDVDPYPGIIPVMKWSGSHTLSISAYKNSYYYLNKPTFADVPVNITYR